MNIIILSIFIVLGLCLIVQYGLLMTQDSKTLDNFWSNNGRNDILNNKVSKKAYSGSIFVCLISGLFLFYYLSFEIDTLSVDIQNGIVVCIMCAIGFSLMWIPLFFLGNYILMTTFLFLVAASFIALLALLINIETDKKKSINKVLNKIAIVCVAYLACHTLIADAIVWSGLL